MVSRLGLLLYRLSGNFCNVQIRYDTRGHGRTGPPNPDTADGYVSERMSSQMPSRNHDTHRWF